MEDIQIVEFKKNILQISFPPQYSEDKELYNTNAKFFNCYAYILQLKIPLANVFPHYQPGFLSNSLPSCYDKETLIKAFFMDCMCLGLDCMESDLNENIDENEFYKIGIFYQFYQLSHFFDFHFIRQNSDFSWSHKQGWYKNVDFVEISDITKKGYNLLNIMKLSKKKF